MKKSEKHTPGDSGSRDGSDSRENVLDKILARIDKTKTEADHRANIDMILKRTSAGKGGGADQGSDQKSAEIAKKMRVISSKGLSATATVKSLKVKIKNYNTGVEEGQKSIASFGTPTDSLDAPTFQSRAESSMTTL